MITFSVEKFLDVLEEIKPLLEKHWGEIAKNKDLIPLDPDYPRYAALQENGALVIFTAREDGNLVGYAVYIVHAHLHYKNTLWAVSDIFWVDPKFRLPTAAIRLFQFVEDHLKKIGVVIMHTTYKVSNPAPGRILEHLGHTVIEAGCSKVLKDN